ncbi:MAG: hypothetical protein QJR03_15580 [Sphaerobacter sp.]|nr:hypothetical protein [Sphaerobacter sp.]
MDDERRPGAYDGQGLLEYSLILVCIALVAVVALIAIGPILQAAYQQGVDAFSYRP